VARFWRSVLVGELLIAALIAWAWNGALHGSLIGALALTLGVFAALQVLWVAVPVIAAGLLFPRAGLSSSTTRSWRALAAELVAFPLAQLAMSAEPWLLRDQSAVPRNAAKPVLLLHGILCNAAVWRRLSARLHAAGFAPVRAINLEPLDADIEAYAASARRELLALHHEGHEAPVAIVAHSMGGLVARSLLRTLGPQVASRIVTVGSPHQGTATACVLPLTGARQMRAGSEWLRDLSAAEDGRYSVPITNVYSRDDALVPAQSAALSGAAACELSGVGHFGLLRSRRALDAIVEALARG
jgi:pimeloyl-ACP methyl ester carboxylesterase